MKYNKRKIMDFENKETVTVIVYRSFFDGLVRNIPGDEASQIHTTYSHRVYKNMKRTLKEFSKDLYWFVREDWSGGEISKDEV